MSVLDDGAAVATMAGGLSIVTATTVWVRTQWRNWRASRRARTARTWDGYIDLGGISSWYVRIAEEPEQPDARVVLEVLRAHDGEPDPTMAYALRNQVRSRGMLARPPTDDEYEFLKDLRKKRGYGGGKLIQ